MTVTDTKIELANKEAKMELENQNIKIGELNLKIREKEVVLRELSLGVNTIDSKYECEMRDQIVIQNQFSMEDNQQQSIRRNIETMVSLIKCINKANGFQDKKLIDIMQSKLEEHLSKLKSIEIEKA